MKISYRRRDYPLDYSDYYDPRGRHRRETPPPSPMPFIILLAIFVILVVILAIASFIAGEIKPVDTAGMTFNEMKIEIAVRFKDIEDIEDIIMSEVGETPTTREGFIALGKIATAYLPERALQLREKNSGAAAEQIYIYLLSEQIELPRSAPEILEDYSPISRTEFDPVLRSLHRALT